MIVMRVKKDLPSIFDGSKSVDFVFKKTLVEKTFREEDAFDDT